MKHFKEGRFAAGGTFTSANAPFFSLYVTVVWPDILISQYSHAVSFFDSLQHLIEIVLLLCTPTNVCYVRQLVHLNALKIWMGFKKISNLGFNLVSLLCRKLSNCT